MKAATQLSYPAIRGEGISIHAAREGGDGGQKMKYCKYLISIHAAREGGDEAHDGHSKANIHFNPRRP